ncbi:MAG: hypothetical protein AAF950_14300 [Pseudomonadota bacterium]
MKEIGNVERREDCRHKNSQAENSHLPFRRREGAMLRFRRVRNLQSSPLCTLQHTVISTKNFISTLDQTSKRNITPPF